MSRDSKDEKELDRGNGRCKGPVVGLKWPLWESKKKGGSRGVRVQGEGVSAGKEIVEGNR